MTPERFKAWRLTLKLSQKEAAEKLRIHYNSVNAYEAGRTPIPYTVSLACAAIAHGLGPWGE